MDHHFCIIIFVEFAEFSEFIDSGKNSITINHIL